MFVCRCVTLRPVSNASFKQGVQQLSRFYSKGPAQSNFDLAACAYENQNPLSPDTTKDPKFETRAEGVPGTKDFRVHVMQHTVGEMDYQQVSPIFSVSLKSLEFPDCYHMVCEIPKNTDEKMEVSFSEEFHSIKQDLTKEGYLRKYKHGVMKWNYGMFPQTWEDDEFVWPGTNLVGDGDPLDVVEIGSTVLGCGEVAKVRPLGVLGMIDQGETDWKVIAINKDDPLAKFIHDIDDVESILPGTLDEIREWFRVYKIPEGGIENTFAFDGKFLSKEFALEIIRTAHEHLYALLPRIANAADVLRTETESESEYYEESDSDQHDSDSSETEKK